MEGAIMGVVLTFLCYDLPWAIAGLRNLTTIISEEGTVNNALSPAGVSMASIMGTLSTQDVVAHAFAKMMLSSDTYRGEAQASWTPGVGGAIFVAPNPPSEPYVGAITDFFCGGGGARTFTDGLDSGGIFHSMASRMANAETVESRVPVIQVYRRELADAGGPGRFRGGVAVEMLSVPHKMPVQPGIATVLCSGVAMPAGRGLSGAAPGAAVANRVLRGAGVRDLFAQGTVPVSHADVPNDEVHVPASKETVLLTESDAVVGIIASGAGYGDPLRRDPDAVARDVAQRLVSTECAEAIYGVVLRDGAADAEATEASRARLREQRMADGRRIEGDAGGGTVRGGTVLHPVSDTVEAVEHDGQRSLRCTQCGYRYGDYGHDHKRSTLMRELPLTAATPHNDLCNPEFVLREFSCPGCGTAVAMDVQHRDEPVLDESRFFAPGQKADDAAA
jgi:N-methylhydantoinase B